MAVVSCMTFGAFKNDNTFPPMVRPCGEIVKIDKIEYKGNFPKVRNTSQMYMQEIRKFLIQVRLDDSKNISHNRLSLIFHIYRWN